MTCNLTWCMPLEITKSVLQTDHRAKAKLPFRQTCLRKVTSAWLIISVWYDYLWCVCVCVYYSYYSYWHGWVVTSHYHAAVYLGIPLKLPTIDILNKSVSDSLANYIWNWLLIVLELYISFPFIIYLTLLMNLCLFPGSQLGYAVRYYSDEQYKCLKRSVIQNFLFTINTISCMKTVWLYFTSVWRTRKCPTI